MQAVSRRRRDAGEVGAGSVEYVGVVGLAVAVVLSLVVTATPVGQAVAAKLCEALGTTCGAPSEPAEADAPPAAPCVVSTSATDISAQVSVSFVDLGGGRAMVTEQLSDGTYRVALSGDIFAGATATAGEATAHLRIGDYGAGLDLSASASAAAKLEGGAEFTFGSAQDAADFQEWAYREFAKDTARSAVSSTATPLMGWTVDAASWVWDRVTGYDYSPPAPTSIYLERGLVASGQAAASGITAGADGSLSFENSLGGKYNLETGETTIYQEVELTAEVAAELGFATLADAEGKVSLMIEATVDKDFNLSSVGFNGTATAEGSYNLAGIAGPALQTVQSGSTGLNVQATYAVTDANRPQTLAALAGLGVTAAVLGPTSMAPAVAIPFIVAEAASNGDVTAQTLDVSSSNLVDAALSLKAPAVGGLGFGLNAGTSTTSSNDAWYLGDHGWNAWEACS